jgi:hypothetical protein
LRTVGRLRRSVAMGFVSVVAGAYLGSWLMAPVGTTPGSPLRMVDAQGTDLGVAALTVSDGLDQRWFRLGDAALGQMPYRLLNILGTFHMGTGQDEAQDRGFVAAGRLMMRGGLEKPIGVSPGVVNGSSSGLAWALATLLLNDPDLRGGEVYATGALFGNGMVASIGGLSAKLQTPGLSEAWRVFVPRSQHRQAIIELNLNGNEEIASRLVGVASVTEALEVLCKDKRKAPTCRQLRKQQTERRDTTGVETDTDLGTRANELQRQPVSHSR